MSWAKYDLVFRLQGPLHIGWRKVSNLQQARGYVPGKNLWAALTARLTREAGDGAKGKAYQNIGKELQTHLRFPYLYPAVPKDSNRVVKSQADLTVHYPWEDGFDYLFLDSYTSTALNYSSQSAEDGMLYETEFIAPHTRNGHPVYLSGSLYVKHVQTALPPVLENWPSALHKLQFGGERGYGWGRVQMVNGLPLQPIAEVDQPMGETITVNERGQERSCITAHLLANNATAVSGPVEPLIGWERNNGDDRDKNWRLSSVSICYAPGSVARADLPFKIGANGIWEAAAP